jgi:hypothetical protein
MGQRDDYQEAIEWLRADGAKLEKAIDYRRRVLSNQTGSGVTHEENPVVPKLNPHGEYMRGLTEIGTKRYELDNQGFFSSNEEGDEWQNAKMAESARRRRAPPLNKTREWKPPPRFKQVLTLLRSSAEAGVSAKAAPKCNE